MRNGLAKFAFRSWLIAIATAVVGLQSARVSSASEFEQFVKPLLAGKCMKCHGGDDINGDVDFKQISTAEQLLAEPELIQKIIEAVDANAMPPEDEPQLSPDQRTRLLDHLKLQLRESVSRRSGFLHAPIRRMNRFQYNNAVTDLFDLKCIVFTLPERMMREHKGYFNPASGKMPDLVNVGSRPLGKSQLIERRLAGVAAFPQDLRAEHGFDNRGDHLSLSPLLMESFLKLGQSITQSPDFTQKNVGIWKTFFEPPADTNNLSAEIEVRLAAFLRKAFRQPAKPELIKRYTNFVTAQMDKGSDLTTAMKSVAAATISSPRFLYVYDKSNSNDSATSVDDFDLASRLSFFLWGSVPDERLLAAAESGDLADLKLLEAQIDRMLADRKLKRFCDSFPAQWLQLERIISSVPSRDKYPQFYFSKYRDSMHMMLEPLLLFETVLIENRPITQLIDPDFSYRSKLLEDAYGKLRSESPQTSGRGGGVGVLNFHRVPVADRRTGGIITNAAVMTMTSGPERTQPITRGAWLATVIFNDPPEPPPADVPALGEKPAEGEEHLTLRERLSLHRKRSDCKGCHEQIDPLGFALENFDPVGGWREKYENGRDVDMSGSLFRKHSFSDVVEFKDAILSEKNRFTRGLAGHLLSYGLARPLDPSDEFALDKITQATIADDYKIQTLLKHVILSEPFRSTSVLKAEPGEL